MMLLIALLMLSQTQSGSGATPKKGTAPPGQGTGNMDIPGSELTEEQKCQFECARQMRNCTMPCAPKSAADANDEKKRDEFMACSKDCMKKSQPCFNVCKQKAPKGEKAKGKPKPKTETAGDQP